MNRYIHLDTDKADNTQHVDKRTLVRNLVIELVVYGILLTVYVIVVLQWLVIPLQETFHNNLVLYSFLSLVLLVAQAVLLEQLTSFLLERLGLKTFE